MCCDRSWYPIAGYAETLLGEAGTHKGGWYIIFAPSSVALTASVILLRMDAKDLSLVNWGGGRG